MLNTLRRLDLNLLLSLDALLAEQHVSRAARRLHLSQPTVSIHLAKLREALGDPLLVAGARGMQATARAAALRAPLQQALAALERVVSPLTPFDPAMAELGWRVAATDYSESTVLLPVLARLRAAAPRTRLAAVALVPTRLIEQLTQGEIDLGFHIHTQALTRLHHRRLFSERYVLVGRAGHPQLHENMSLTQFCALEHAIVSSDGGGFHGPTDVELARRGLARTIALSVPHFLFLRAALAETDLVAMLPSRLVAGDARLRSVSAPLAVPGFDMLMLWHERAHADSAHQWLRQQIMESVAGDDAQTESLPE